MVNLRQVVFSFLSKHLLSSNFPSEINGNEGTRSIAVIGAGSAGLGMLKSLVELPEETKQRLDFVLYEEREDVGGVWLPETTPVYPPEIPETPLYPRLRTNTPVPSMTYPGFTFPPNTSLYPSHHHLLAYHQRFATESGLYPFIRFHHKVIQAEWIGSSERGQWNITIRNENGEYHWRFFDHLVVASGNNHIPRIVTWEGQEEWLSNTPDNSPKREILHSVYYRDPDRYTNQTVLIVGGGASGRDAAGQIAPLARKTYISLRHPLDGIPGVEVKTSISHFTRDHVVFDDGSKLEVDSVLLGTGYVMRKPFLEDGHTIYTDPSAHTNETVTKGLVTNLKYIFPLHKHIFSLCPSHPPTALAFIGLPSAIANCPSDYAQGLFVTNLILNPDVLPSREEMLEELALREQEIRDKGFDPYTIGHRLLDATSSDYQDELVDFLKAKKLIPDNGRKYVESWRRATREYLYLRRGWIHVEEIGAAEEWLKGVETEAEWADLMERLNAWQKKLEEESGIKFVPDYDLAG
ncbi:hypothetical protein M422DRAFT_203031 [Sphaerobolus stellatus SS14]|nr:hypothetical protein M422DRAFT_203031 [Sphaerobolus stellatus SS14]